ncbi:MAG: chaperone surA [Pseudomonadota bacterium]|jgi:peptidyl-prolyl cis-trans isomerase SurA
MGFRKICGAWIAVLALLSVAPARADYQELDAIVALVNDDVILASELLSRLKTVQDQITEQKMQMPPRDVIISQIMERLILESLQMQDAERRGVSIDDEQLTAAVASIAEQNGLTMDQFQQTLLTEGLNYSEFREQIRREMMISRLQRNLISRRVAISEQEVNDLINSPYYKQLLSDEYRVGHILLSIADEDDQAARSAAREAANEIVASLREGADFAQTAIARSSGARALEGGDLGWRRAAELPSIFSEQVLELKAGDVANPIETPGGIHIIKLLEVRGASQQTEQQTRARHILVTSSAIRSEADTEALAREIYGRLQAGEEFEALAREFSEDPGSALAGGDLGFSSGEEFVPEFREAMAETATGELAAPFRSQFGWHILQVLERREEDLSEEARRNMAARVIQERRFQEELEKWQKELRDEAFVENRI